MTDGSGGGDIGDLSSLLAHIVRDPWSLVVGYNDLIKQSATDPSVARWAGQAAVASDQMSPVLDELLALVSASIRLRPRDEVVDGPQLLDAISEAVGLGGQALTDKVSFSVDPRLSGSYRVPRQFGLVVTAMVERLRVRSYDAAIDVALNRNDDAPPSGPGTVAVRCVVSALGGASGNDAPATDIASVRLLNALASNWLRLERSLPVPVITESAGSTLALALALRTQGTPRVGA